MKLKELWLGNESVREKRSKLQDSEGLTWGQRIAMGICVTLVGSAALARGSYIPALGISFFVAWTIWRFNL